MPETRVQDEQGNIHVFPDGATPEMIAGALGVKPPRPNMALNPPGVQRPIPSELHPGMTLTPQGAMSYRQATAAGPNQPSGQAEAAMGFGTSAAQTLSDAGRANLTGASFAAPIMFPPATILGRILQGAGIGGAATAGGGGDLPQTAKGAALGAGMQGLAETLPFLAPKMAESALGITERMRGRGRTIGPAVLSETSGVRPTTIAQQGKQQISNLTQQMEGALNQATQQGAIGSTQTAHDVLNDAIAKAPRNARGLTEKLQGLHSLLDLDNAPGPVRGAYTPTELLEMKRGIGTEMQTWPPEWQRLPAVKQVQQRLYGAIDGELDRLVPGNAEINQRISSLIPAKQQAARLSDQASIGQRLAHRAAAHTGALAGTGIGGYLGSQEGQTPQERRQNAMLGAAAGFVLPEFLTTPAAQMTAARMASGAPQTVPYALPFMRYGVSKKTGEQENSDQQ